MYWTLRIDRGDTGKERGSHNTLKLFCSPVEAPYPDGLFDVLKSTFEAHGRSIQPLTTVKERQMHREQNMFGWLRERLRKKYKAEAI